MQHEHGFQLFALCTLLVSVREQTSVGEIVGDTTEVFGEVWENPHSGSMSNILEVKEKGGGIWTKVALWCILLKTGNLYAQTQPQKSNFSGNLILISV